MKINESIKFGKSNILSRAIQDKDVKVRITTMVDSDVLKKLKEIADKTEKGYQTILNDILREALFSERAESAMLSELEEVRRAIIVIARDMEKKNPESKKQYTEIIDGMLWNSAKKKEA